MARTPYNCTVLRTGAGPYVYWSLDTADSATALADLSGNGFNGTFDSGDLTQPGLIFGAGGDDGYTSAGASGGLQAQTITGVLDDFTMTLWDQRTTGVNNKSIWAGGTLDSTGGTHTIKNHSEARGYRIRCPGVDVNEEINSGYGFTHFLVLTWESSTGEAKLWRDAVNTITATGTVGASLNLNNRMQLHQGGAAGSLDEPALFDFILTEAQIQQLYDCGTSGTDCISCGGVTMQAPGRIYR